MKKFFTAIILLASVGVYPAQTTLVSSGSSWKYFTGSFPGAGWNASSFNDGSWSSGPSQLGFGEGDEATVIPSGPLGNYFPAAYFRSTFNVTDASLFGTLALKVKRDDGVVLYLNGTEIFRDNMSAGTPGYPTLAPAASNDDGQSWLNITIPSTSLITGTNLISAEIHQSSVASSDLSFDLQLIANPVGTILVERGPYLQMGTSNSIIIKWNTDVATDAKVTYGESPIQLTSQVTDVASNKNHNIQLSGLLPNTKYYYSIGTSTSVLQNSNEHFFITAPAIGSSKKSNIWITGDCGTGYIEQTNVLQAYENFIDTNYTDCWLLVGDNAYTTGLDHEYQNNFFQPYMSSHLMKQTVIWPTPGNHDYYNTSDLNSRTTPYFQNFTVPTNGEVGGVPSGTESYYSYNYANIHFISLDSYGTENDEKLYDTTCAQINWLKQDLVANTQKWTIVYWHHPPYTKGSHNSDTETDLVSVRNKVVRILERYKVDMIICGHSHCYERSKLMKGHYGLENTFNAGTHQLSTSSAKYDGSSNSCPYLKSSSTAINDGVVYVVTGSAGKLSGTTSGWPHNAMYYSNNTNAGSMYLEINDNRLDAKFISETGSILDKFTIMKDVNTTTNVTIPQGQQITMNATWPGDYNWNINAATTQQLAINPSQDTIYVVNDDLNCLRDSFIVNVTPSINISENLTIKKLKIFPNPTSGKFSIQLNEQSNEKTSLEVFNFEGKKIAAEKLKLNKDKDLYEFDLRSINDGQYLILIKLKQVVYEAVIQVQKVE
ncbi:MAG: metallophosphoesterase [Bacteroidota bacterium]|nr:metallophosphoesterase [Bacteroidota bacterium]